MPFREINFRHGRIIGSAISLKKKKKREKLRPKIINVRNRLTSSLLSSLDLEIRARFGWFDVRWRERETWLFVHEWSYLCRKYVKTLVIRTSLRKRRIRSPRFFRGGESGRLIECTRLMYAALFLVLFQSLLTAKKRKINRMRKLFPFCDLILLH